MRKILCLALVGLLALLSVTTLGEAKSVTLRKTKVRRMAVPVGTVEWSFEVIDPERTAKPGELAQWRYRVTNSATSTETLNINRMGTGYSLPGLDPDDPFNSDNLDWPPLLQPGESFEGNHYGWNVAQDAAGGLAIEGYLEMGALPPAVPDVWQIDVRIIVSSGWPKVYNQILRRTRTEDILPTVRHYRDDVVMVDPQGAKLVKELYESHSEALAEVLVRRPGIARRGAALVKEYLPGLEKAVDEGQMVMTPAQLAEVSAFLDDIAKAGNRELQAYIKRVQALLKDEKALASLGVEVSERMLRAPGQSKGSLTATWGALKSSVEGQ